MSLLFLAVISFGQAQEGSVTYLKKQHPAAVIELPYSPSVVDDAMNDYLSKKGRSKSNNIKGFTTYRNTQPAVTDSANADLYFKTERKSKMEKEVTVVSLLLNPNLTSGKTTNLHYMNMDDARNLLNNLAEVMVAYDLELNIKEQNNAVIRAEAKYKSLSDDGNEMEKKRADLDKKISENKAETEAQMKEVESQKTKLAQWVSQRKS